MLRERNEDGSDQFDLVLSDVYMPGGYVLRCIVHAAVLLLYQAACPAANVLLPPTALARILRTAHLVLLRLAASLN